MIDSALNTSNWINMSFKAYLANHNKLIQMTNNTMFNLVLT